MPDLKDLLEARTAKPAGFTADSGAVYVLSDLSGTFQLYRVPVGGGELEQLTDLNEPILAFPIPGQSGLVVSVDSGGNEREQLYLHSGEPGAELEPLVVEPDFLHRAPRLSPDGALLAYSCNRRNGADLDVYLRALDGGDERCVFDRGGPCSAASFSPDGRLLAVHRPTERSSDDELWLVDLASGDVTHVTPHDDESEYGAPEWVSPTVFLCASNEGRETFAVRRFDVASGEWATMLESEWDLTCWVDPTGETLLVEENADGYSRLELRDAGTLDLRRELPLPGRGVLGMPYEEPRFSPDGRLLAYQYTSPLVPGDVWLADVQTGETARLTRSPNDLDAAELTEPELHRFPSFDGESIPVFLFEPRGHEGLPPVVFVIHGGPEAQLRPIWQPLIQYFVSHGLAVAAPNVRGSTGYGKTFTKLDNALLREDPVKDIGALLDWIKTRPDLDADRILVSGGSYGGFMSLAVASRYADRIRCSVDIVGISNFVTFLERTEAYRRDLRRVEYGDERDPATRAFMQRIAPVNNAAAITRPILVVQGKNDPRVPLAEAEQIVATLRKRGTKAWYLMARDEGHGFAKKRNADYLAYVLVTFIKKHLLD